MMLHSRFLKSILIALLLAAIWTQSPSAAAQDAIATLHIPAIEVSAPIVPIYIKAFADGNVTWDTSGLHMTSGYLDGTGWFGQAGNIVIGGHSELARGQADVFYRLDQVAVGAEITIHIDGAELRYVVVNVYRVNYQDLSPLYPTDHEQLTLITCDLGSYNASTGTYSNRVVVVAHRVG